MQTAPNPNQRWRLIEDVFQSAAQLDPAARVAYLEQVCGSDTELRREVESLLEGLDRADPFLEAALGGAARSYLVEPPPADGELAEGTVLEQYRVVRKLGSGGMGEVYLAEDTLLERKVALKFLAQPLTRNPELLQRFEREARTLSALNHTNLLTVYAFCHSDGRYFLVTEFVQGQTLRELLKVGGLKEEAALDIATQIAAALSVAHASGVVHRDIKPENIMVRADGCVKVLDFGIAKLIEPADWQPRSLASPVSPPPPDTVPGLLVGTPRYMSPEQIRGGAVDKRSDIFSLGAVFHEMLTGKPAFCGDTQSDLMADVLRTEPRPVAAKDLQAILSRALAKDRDQRYQRVDEMVAELAKARRNRELRTLLAPRPAFQLFALAALLLALAGGAVFWMRDRSAPDRGKAPRSLAVLPFRNLRPSADSDFLGFSLADEVIEKLGYVKALTVRPASAVNRYREGAADLRRVAADLNADLLLTGTYLKDGDDLKITARLMGSNPESVLWQNSLTVKYGNLLSVQDRVARMIIQGLELRLKPDEQASLKHDAPSNQLAYEYFLRGVDLYAVSDFAAAIVMLEKSATIDANYAPTWAHLGRAYTTNASLQFGGREDYRRAEAAYDKAIALNPVFPEPRVYMANLLTDTGRVEGAVPLLRGALQSSPNNAEAHWELGYAYRYGGMLPESKAECELARQLDPEVKINSSAMNTYLYLGEYQTFLNSVPANDSPLLVFYRGLGSYYLHNDTVAVADFDRAYELAPQLLQAQIGKTMSLGLKGNKKGGIALLRETERKLMERGVSDPEGLYKVAQAYAVLGNAGDALRLLLRSVNGGFFCYSYLASDPLLGPLRKSAEFARIVEQARERSEQFRRRFGEAAN